METNNQTIRATASAPAGLVLVETSRPLSPDEFKQIRAAGFAWQADARAFVAPWTAETFAAAGRIAGRVDVENAGGTWHNVAAVPPSGEEKTAPAPAGGALPTIERDAIKSLGDFVGRSQLAAILDAMRGEEGEYFGGMVADLAQRIDAMPQTYQQDGMGDAAIVGLHYFNSGSDWYITEKDADGGTAQAFGYAVLNGWDDCAELGYISIAELVAHGVELDLYWQPRTLGEVKAERGGDAGGPDGAGTIPPSGEKTAADAPSEATPSGEQTAPTTSGEVSAPFVAAWFYSALVDALKAAGWEHEPARERIGAGRFFVFDRNSMLGRSGDGWAEWRVFLNAYGSGGQVDGWGAAAELNAHGKTPQAMAAEIVQAAASLAALWAQNDAPGSIQASGEEIAAPTPSEATHSVERCAYVHQDGRAPIRVEIRETAAPNGGYYDHRPTKYMVKFSGTWRRVYSYDHGPAYLGEKPERNAPIVEIMAAPGSIQAPGEEKTAAAPAAATTSGEDEARATVGTPDRAEKIQTVERRDGTGRAWLALAGVPKGCDSLHPLQYRALGVAQARAAKLRGAGIAATVCGRGPFMIKVDPSGEVVADVCPTLLPGRWIPGGAENAERIAFDAALGAEVWLIASSARPGALAVIAYAGKRTKHGAHYTMRDRAQALTWAGEYMGKQQAAAQRQTDRRAEKAAKRAAGHKLKAGDVLRCSWGYDQTNIDYYEVTRLIGARMVEIRKIGAESVNDGGLSMTGDCVPRPGHYIGEPMRKAVSDYDGQSVRIASYAHASKIEPREVAGVKLYPVDHWTAYA